MHPPHPITTRRGRKGTRSRVPHPARFNGACPADSATPQSGPKVRATLAWGNAPGTRILTHCGPTARATLAWGNAPGVRIATPSGLKARAKTPPHHESPFAPLTLRPPLIPHKPLIERDPILREHRPHLRLIIPSPMMLTLRIDIPDQRRPITQPHRERRIPALPSEPRELRPPGLDPLRRRNLQPLHQLRHRLRSRDIQRNMDVIAHPAHPHANILSPNRRRQNRMHLASNCVRQHWPAPLRTEDQMHQHVRERLRHANDYSAGLQPARTQSHFSQGRANEFPRSV